MHWQVGEPPEFRNVHGGAMDRPGSLSLFFTGSEAGFWQEVNSLPCAKGTTATPIFASRQRTVSSARE